MRVPRVRRWVRISVSLTVLATMLAFVPVRQLVAALSRVPLQVLVWTVVLFICGHIAAALKWRLLQGNNTGLTLLTTVRAHFCGVVANLWLPGVVGGDLVRATVTFRQSTRPALVALASLLDRLIDSVGLLFLAAGGLLLVNVSAGNGWRVLGAAAVLAVAGGAVLVCGYLYLRAHASHPRNSRLLEAVGLLVERPGRVVGAFVLSVAIQATFILVNLSLGRAVGMSAPPSAWFMAWPLAKLAALIPVSAAGLGVREAALVMLMRPFGDPPQTIMAAGLLWQAVFLIGGILGWGAFFFMPEQSAAAGIDEAGDGAAPVPASME